MRFQSPRALPVLFAGALAAILLAIGLVQSCQSNNELHAAIDTAPSAASMPPAPALGAGPDVMQSSFCASCHPNEYAEHEQNTHGRAFTDEEVRLATARFAHQDCIICHTPRPIFETGVGMNPMRRHYDLEEGNSCMTCHWKPEYDYTKFKGGAECKGAFHPDVGTVEACASCHRNHGTPYQWEKSPNGKLAGRTCMDCHMKTVTREIAVGGPVREVRSHIFPGARNEAHVAKAYSYETAIEGNTVVVTITNKGAGHNFPTELKQRSLESLIVVRDREGNEVSRSRMVFRDPYKRPYGLDLPVNTQIPSGQSREHRVPVRVADGTVECELHYKYYFPIEDHHPDLARQLEGRKLPFAGLTPSTEEVVSEPEVQMNVPEGIDPMLAGPANLVDFAHPKIAKVPVDIPQGDSAADVQKLIELLQFPVPEANGKARKRLTELGAKAVPALIEGLGSWDNKTFNQSMQVLEAIGAPAVPAIEKAVTDEHLYKRRWAREVAVRLQIKSETLRLALEKALTMHNALDRATAAQACGALHFEQATPALRKLLADADPDVVRAAGLALAHLGVKEAANEIAKAMGDARYDETRRDLAGALARLGDTRGIQNLIRGLDHRDDLIRESFFETFFAATGIYEGYEPLAPRDDRLAAIARIQTAWAKDPSAAKLVVPGKPDPKKVARAVKLAGDIGGNDLTPSTPDDDAAYVNELIDIGDMAVPALANGLKWAPGFVDKRVAICNALGQIGSKKAAPILCATLRDPVVRTASWACWALERVKDPASIPSLVHYEQRLRSLAAAGRIPESAGSADYLILQAARARLMLGDERAKDTVIGALVSGDEGLRRSAIDALRKHYGEDKGFDPLGPDEERREAVKRWFE